MKNNHFLQIRMVHDTTIPGHWSVCSTASHHPILDPNALCTESAFIALDPRQSDMQSVVFEVTVRCKCRDRDACARQLWAAPRRAVMLCRTDRMTLFQKLESTPAKLQETSPCALYLVVFVVLCSRMYSSSVRAVCSTYIVVYSCVKLPVLLTQI